MKTTLLLLLTLLCSCSAVRVKTMGTTLISPEAQGELGKGGVDVRATALPTYKFDFSNDRTNNKLYSEGSTLQAGVGGDLGILKRLDINLVTASTSYIGLKYQLIGEPRKEAKKGSFSLALFYTGGKYSKEGKEDEYLIASDLYDLDSIKISMESEVYGVSIGHRFWERTLTYLSIARIYQDMDGEVTTTDDSLVNEEFSYRNSGESFGLGIVRYPTNTKLALKFEVSSVKTHWSYTGARTNTTIAFGLGVSW